MSQYLGAIAFATFIWWFSTGVIFFLNARPVRTFRWSMLAGTVILCFAIFGIWQTAGTNTVFAAFAGFTCGLVIWGWHTMSYYMGVITGPRKKSCSTDCGGWRHFVHAIETGLYHELAIIATAALLAVLALGQPNQYGLWTFLLLWGMHVSAKLNVFLGVRNLNKDFIPERLKYLTGFFRRRTMNLLFPFSVTIGTVITIMMAQTAGSSDSEAFVATGHTLLATLMALAVIEHWFMMLPIPTDILWRWSLDPLPVGGPQQRTESASGQNRLQHVDGRAAAGETGRASPSGRARQNRSAPTRAAKSESRSDNDLRARARAAISPRQN